MRAFLIAICLGLFGPSIAVMAAANYSVFQKGRMFSVETLIVQRNEKITFVNDDTVSHNILSKSHGNEFNLGSQHPGISTDVAFTESGEVNIICAIHPRMRMTVTVTD